MLTKFVDILLEVIAISMACVLVAVLIPFVTIYWFLRVVFTGRTDWP